MDYMDFDLEVEAEGERNYRVAARSPEGDTRQFMLFPFDKLELENHLLKLQNALLKSGGQYRATLTSDEQTVQDFGQNLFEALLSGRVRALYDTCRTRAVQEGRPGVRLRLRILAPDLAAVPWEYLYDQHRGEYLSLSRRTPLVRYLEVAQPIVPLKITPPLRILAMVASPSEQPPLNVEHERERLHLALSDLEARGLVKLEWLPGQTWRDLQRAMRGGPWHIFHFIGHGGFHPQAQEGMLALANDEGSTHLLSATQLASLLANHDALRLAILNACEGATSNKYDLFSSTAATLVRRGIPAVLAMQYAISDRAAIECSRAFYEALADGLPVDSALIEARTAIHIGVNNSLEWGTPVLYLRTSNGVLFEEGEHYKEPQKRERLQPEADPDQYPAIFDPTKLILLHTLSSHTSCVWSVAISPDGKTLASSSGTPPLLRSVRKVGTFFGRVIGIGNTGAVNSDDNTVRLWELPSGRELCVLSGHTDYVTSVAFSPDGKTLVSAGRNTIKLWELPFGRELQTFSGYTGGVGSVAFSPDGKILASGGWTRTSSSKDNDGSATSTIKFWELLSGRELRTLSGHMGSVGSVAFSPDGKTLASGSNDNTIRLWELPSGRELRILTGHADYVTSVAFSPDGRTLASAGGNTSIKLPFGHTSAVDGNDNTIRFWELPSGRELRTLTGHTSAVTSVAFSPDGNMLASGSADKTIWLWGMV